MGGRSFRLFESNGAAALDLERSIHGAAPGVALCRALEKREGAAPLALATVVVLVIVEADIKKRGRMEMLRRLTGRANACALWSIQRLTAGSWGPRDRSLGSPELHPDWRLTAAADDVDEKT